MAVAFVRQLGHESGVQLNPLRDNSEIPASGIADQVFGIIMRATRGRIDRPFVVDRSNVYTKLGKGESIQKNALNTAWVHVVEALNKGAYQCVVQRMHTSASKIKWAVLKTSGATSSFEANEEMPTSDFVLAVKHLGCHNEGIKISLHADEVKSSGASQDAKVLSLRVLDADNVIMFEFKGSLDPDAKDDFGQTYYLPNVISSQTDEVECVVLANAVISKESDSYGNDALTREKWATSDLLECFTEGTTTYNAQDITKFRTLLQNTPHDFAYIASGGSEDVQMIPQLVQLAFDTNKQLRFDVPGRLGVTAAQAWLDQFNLAGAMGSHLMHAFWAPLRSDDPTGVNGRGHYGVATLNIAMSCLRNAQKNAKGFAPKNYPVAGREWPIQRTRVSQTTIVRKEELSDLAKSKINPCVYETYTGGGRYVFRDALTCAPVENSMRKLISVADMSTHIDEMVTRAGKDFLLLPMDVAIGRMNDFLTTLFEDAEASGWLIPSEHMDGKSHIFQVAPNEMRPYDVMDVNYWLRYDGIARQIMVTQTISR